MTERQGSWKIAASVVLSLGISAIFYAVMARTGPAFSWPRRPWAWSLGESGGSGRRDRAGREGQGTAATF